jgi:hypothetical protein
MAGSANLNVPSYLPTLLGLSSPGSSLLATLYSYAAPASGTVNPIAALEQARFDEAQQVALVAAQPQVKRDIAQFAQTLAAAETPARLLGDPVALRVLLIANGMADQVGNTALATRALLADPARPDSLLATLVDQRWRSVSQAYSFATRGLAILSDPKTIAMVANRYADALWRTQLDRTTPGLSNALDFLRRASTIIDVDQLFGDPTFRAVITTALGVSPQIAPAARERAISTRIDLRQFQNPAFVTQFTHRYLIAARQAATQTAGMAASGLSTDLSTFAEPSADLVI